MDYNTIVTLIGSVGFPIIMCLLMFKYIQTISEVHKEEVSGLSKAVEENTLAVQTLCTLISGKEENDA